MKEVLNDNSKKIEQSKILTQLKLKTNNFFVVSAHRQENIESEINFNKILSIISEVESHFELPIIVSTHPRTRKN